MIVIIRQFHYTMRACVRLDHGACSGWFAVEQPLRQGCALAPLLVNIFFVTVINVAYTRLKADNRERASPGDVALGHYLR